MHSAFKKSGIYFITDSKLSIKGVIWDAQQAIAGGAAIVQYREKNKTKEMMIQEARKLKKICKGKATFIINDRVDVALAVDADGVHLGKEDLPYTRARKMLGKQKIIGLTTHSLKEALLSQKKGADYIGVGPIFKTTSKNLPLAPRGIGLIKQAKEKLAIPIVAIGGINQQNIQTVAKAGATHVAVISAAYKNGNLKKNILALRKEMRP